MYGFSSASSLVMTTVASFAPVLVGENVIVNVVLPAGATVVIHSGRRYLRMKGADLDNYRGERGRRGNKLPRGFQKVDRVELAAD